MDKLKKNKYKNNIKPISDCPVTDYKVDKNLASTLLAGKEGSFSCQGENWDGSAKGVNYMQVVVAGLAIQWLQNYFIDNEVFEYKVVNA